MNEQYTTGKCSKCGKSSPLKRGLCPKCQGIDIDLPPEFKEIFGMNNQGKDNSE